MEAKKSGLRKFVQAIRKYVKLRNWRKSSLYATECYMSILSGLIMRKTFQMAASL